jgi:hypothetical protein
MKIGKPAIHLTMAWPLITMLVGFSLYLGYIVLTRARAELLRRERGSWLRAELAVEEVR